MKFKYMSIGKLLLEHSHAYSFMHYTGTVGTIWVRKPKIFTIWPKLAKSWASTLLEQVKQMSFKKWITEMSETFLPKEKSKNKVKLTRDINFMSVKSLKAGTVQQLTWSEVTACKKSHFTALSWVKCYVASTGVSTYSRYLSIFSYSVCLVYIF